MKYFSLMGQFPLSVAWAKPLTRCFKFYLAIAFVLVTTGAMSQVVLPPANIDCPSKDLEVTRAILPAPNTDPCSCSGSRILQLGIINKTGSDRTSFAMWGKLVRKDANGNPVGSPEPIFACASGIKASSTNFYPTTTSITVACNQSLEITDVILAWTSANKKETCDILFNNPTTINPKCGRVESIRVETGVDADFTVTNATCVSPGSIQVFPFGGTAPYKVKIGTDERTNIPAGGSVIFSNLAANTYSITITDARPCSTLRTRTISAPPSISTPEATVNQPTCTVAKGTVNVTSPDNTVTYTLKQGGVIKYTADNGVFNSVDPGTYDLVATKGACSATGSQVVVNAQPQTPATPTADVTQPTCEVSTGSILVNGPDATITYTLTGPSPSVATQSNNTGSFTGLAAGTYSITATKNGCTSPSVSKTVNAQPQTPATPTAEVTQPSCTVATGAIHVNDPDATVTYTLTGPSPSVTTQSNNTGSFTGLAAGSYSLTATKNGCTSPAVSKTVNAQPQTPATPTAEVTQPSCTVATGAIQVNNPDATITYTLTGPSPSVTTQSNNTGHFTGLAAGTYGLTATKNGCTSPSLSKTVNAQPQTPSFTVCLVQPSLCANSGSVTISASGGSGFQYTINGGTNWSGNNVFSNLGSGSVTGIQVKNSDGCISTEAACDAPSDCSGLTQNRPQKSGPAPTLAKTTISSSELLAEKLAVKAFPNPYNDKVNLVVSSPASGNGSLEVVNILGQKIKTVYQGRINAGNQVFEISIPSTQRSVLIYIFRMGDKQITGKLLPANR